MQASDRSLFALEMTLLAEVLLRGDVMSPARLQAYFDDLVAWPIGEVTAAIQRCRRTCVYFPAPVEIAEEIQRARRERSDTTPRLRAAPPSPEEQARVHAMVSELVRKLKAGEPIPKEASS